MADLSVQFYVYRNQNIRGIILDNIYHYRSVLVRGLQYSINCFHLLCFKEIREEYLPTGHVVPKYTIYMIQISYLI